MEQPNSKPYPNTRHEYQEQSRDDWSVHTGDTITLDCITLGDFRNQFGKGNFCDLSYDVAMWMKFGLLLLIGMSSAQSTTMPKDWELVRSVPNGFGGTLDLVLVPVARERDREYYNRVADAVCGSRTTCMVNFWTDRAHIPDTKSGWISAKDLAVMTASYERNPRYAEPSLHLACWLYPSKSVGEAAKCEYEPSAEKPPDR